MQVAVVHAHDLRANCQRAIQLGFVVHFDQRLHAKRVGQRQQLGHARVVERGDDQQQRVGAIGARLVHLVGVDNEIFSQQRHRQLLAQVRANAFKVLQAALEKALVGEHRDRRRAIFGIGTRQHERVEILDQHAFGGRGFFDLGDQRHAVGPAQRGVERARRGRIGGQRLELGERDFGRLARNFGALVVEDARQKGFGGFGRHGLPCVYARIFISTRPSRQIAMPTTCVHASVSANSASPNGTSRIVTVTFVTSAATLMPQPAR